MSELSGKQASVYATGTSTATTGIATTSTDYLTYTISETAKTLLDPSITAIVKVGGVAVNASTYTIYYLLGKIVFTNARASSDVVTIDANYIPKVQVASAYDFTFGKGVDMLDVTRFGDDAKRRITGLKYAYGTLSKWDITETTFTDALSNGSAIYIVLSHGAGNSNVILAYVDKDEMKAVISDPQSETVSFVSADSNFI